MKNCTTIANKATSFLMSVGLLNHPIPENNASAPIVIERMMTIRGFFLKYNWLQPTANIIPDIVIRDAAVIMIPVMNSGSIRLQIPLSLR